MLAGPSRWGQAPGRSAAHGRSLAGPVDPVRIPPLALDPYLVEQRYHRQHLRIFGVSNFVILDACLRPDQCWGVLAGLCGAHTGSVPPNSKMMAGRGGRRARAPRTDPGRAAAGIGNSYTCRRPAAAEAAARDTRARCYEHGAKTE